MGLHLTVTTDAGRSPVVVMTCSFLFCEGKTLLRSIATFETVALPFFVRFETREICVSMECQCVCKVQETLWSAEDTGTLLMQETSFGEVVTPHSLKRRWGVTS